MDFINELNALKPLTSSTSGQSNNPFISELNALPPIKRQPASLSDLSYAGLPDTIPNLPTPTVNLDPYVNAYNNATPPLQRNPNYNYEDPTIPPLSSFELPTQGMPGYVGEPENIKTGMELGSQMISPFLSVVAPAFGVPMLGYELASKAGAKQLQKLNDYRAKQYGMPVSIPPSDVIDEYINPPDLTEELSKQLETMPSEQAGTLQKLPDNLKYLLASFPSTAGAFVGQGENLKFNKSPIKGRQIPETRILDTSIPVRNEPFVSPLEKYAGAKRFNLEDTLNQDANIFREKQFAEYEAQVKNQQAQQVKSQEDQILKYQAQQATQQPLGVVEPPTDFIPAQKDVGALIRQTPYKNKFIPSAEEVQAEMEALKNQPAPENNGIPNLYQFMGNKSEQIPDANLLRQSRQGNIPPIPKDINYIQPDIPIQHRFISDAIPPDIPVASEEIALRNEMANLPNKFGMNERLPNDPLDVRDAQIQKRIREEQERELFKQGLMGKNAEFARKVGMSERLPEELTNDFIDELNALSKETGQNKQVKKPTTFEPLPTLPQEPVKFADEVASPVSPASSLANENVGQIQQIKNKPPTVPPQPAQAPPQAIKQAESPIIPEAKGKASEAVVEANKQPWEMTQSEYREKTKRNIPEVAQPISVKSGKIKINTMDGEKNARVKFYELPGYKGEKLAVREKTTRGKKDYFVYIVDSSNKGYYLRNHNDLNLAFRQSIQDINNIVKEKNINPNNISQAFSVENAIRKGIEVKPELLNSFPWLKPKIELTSTPNTAPPAVVSSGQGQIIPERLPDRPTPAVEVNKQTKPSTYNSWKKLVAKLADDPKRQAQVQAKINEYEKNNPQVSLDYDPKDPTARGQFRREKDSILKNTIPFKPGNIYENPDLLSSITEQVKNAKTFKELNEIRKYLDSKLPSPALTPGMAGYEEQQITKNNTLDQKLKEWDSNKTKETKTISLSPDTNAFLKRVENLYNSNDFLTIKPAQKKLIEEIKNGKEITEDDKLMLDIWEKDKERILTDEEFKNNFIRTSNKILESGKISKEDILKIKKAIKDVDYDKKLDFVPSQFLDNLGQKYKIKLNVDEEMTKRATPSEVAGEPGSISLQAKQPKAESKIQSKTEPKAEPKTSEPAFPYEPFTTPEQKQKLTELNAGVDFVKKIKNFLEELRGKRFGSSSFKDSSASSPASGLQVKKADEQIENKIGEADVYVKDRPTRWFKQNIWKGNSTPKFQGQFDTVANNITAETQKAMDEVVHDLIFEKTFDQLKPWEKALHNNQFTRNFMKMLPHNEQVLMGDMMNADKGFKVGDTVTEASYVAKLKELGFVKDARTKSLAKRAYGAADMMDNQAKQALEQGLIKDKEYADHYMKYMPRLYDRYEMGSISKKGKFELNKIIENKSLPEQTRNMAKALLEPDVYRSELEAFSKHVQDVAKNAELTSSEGSKASGYVKIGNNWSRYGSDLQGKWLRKDVYDDLNNQINKFKQINHIIDEADRRVSKLTTYNASPTKLNLGEFEKRKDIPKQIRDALGEIHTPGYPIAKRTAQTIRDLQLDDFFKKISKDPESVLPLETQERLAGQGNEIIHNGKYYKLMPNSDTENWGLLRNRYVESGIADELISTKNGLDKTLETIEMITRPIKYGLVPLNNLSHVVQWGSNSIFANLAGVPIWEVPGKFAKKSGDLLTRSPLYQEALKNGVLNGAYFKEAVGSLYKFYNVIATGGGIDKVTEIMKGLWHLPGQVFSASDQIAKLAVYDHVKNISIKNGMSEANAIAHAVEMSKMIPDYHRMPKLVRIADVFSPFIAFTVKSNEIMAKAAFSKDPNMLLRTWKYPAMAGGLTAYLIANGMLKPEDIPANRNKFEEYPGAGLIKDPYVRGLYNLMGDAMSGQNVYLPDGKGGANKVSVSKFSPIGNQFFMNAEKTGLQREFGLSNNLAVKAYQPIFEGKDQYGNKLKDEERIPYAVNQFVAPVRNINRIGKDLEGDAKNKIPPRSIGNVIAKDVLGVDVSPVISPANRFSNANEFYFKKKKIQDEIRKIEKNGLKGVFGKQSAETAKEAIAKRRKELKQLEDEYNSRFVK